jgi:hypothetical protein
MTSLDTNGLTNFVIVRWKTWQFNLTNIENDRER